MKVKVFLTLFSMLFFYSCETDHEVLGNDQNYTSDTAMSDLMIPSSFNFLTTQEIEVEVYVKGLQGQALQGVKVSFYTEHPDFGGVYLSSAFTNSLGNLSITIRIPTYIEDIFVQAHTVGFANQIKMDVSPFMHIQFRGDLSHKSNSGLPKSASGSIPISSNYYYMGTYASGNQNGLPDYLEPTGDNLSQALLDAVNASLPENKPVPTFNPQYLTSNNELDIVVTDSSEVWVTFVAEGAGYKNSLGYYVYDTNSPPSNPSQIDSIFVILPNASLVNSGGQLSAGDKVRLGTFGAGKTISWVLFQNAWDGSGVNVNGTKFYSKSEFNTVEIDPNKRQHTVQLADFGNELLLNGFEDQTRSFGSDNDFNDLIFYVSANPWEHIETGNIPTVTPSTDTDGDGISDETDEFPDDPLRALQNNYSGSLAFEDLWPAEGDYDFNDLVMDYDIGHILNGNNLLVDIDASWTIKAIFASFSNGFGVSFDNVPSSEIASVSNLYHANNIITANANGAEANLSNASIIFYDNVFDVVQESGSLFPHTTPPTTIQHTITFSQPISQNSTGYPPYNPFIFVDGKRDKEVHLPGKAPTGLANPQFFGTSSDATSISNSYFYKTSNGLPWAIHVPQSFDFPDAGHPINEAYHFFSTWATNGGTVHKDWYRDLPGHRDITKIY